MFQVKFESGYDCKTILTFDAGVLPDELWTNLENKGFSRNNFYILQNGKLLPETENLLQGEGKLIPKVLGGKGGFGSMLRAIGAQIEKTTNREACRDLSGRRLRDINEEKRLKAWIEKQGSRKEEEAEKKRKKLERLVAEPKHEFKDQNYERERSVLTERIDDAVEQGFKTAAEAASTSVVEQKKPKNKGIKRKTILDDFDEIDSDELTSSDAEEAQEPSKKVLKQGEKSDSGCSSSVEDHSESSCDKNLQKDEEKTDEIGEKQQEKSEEPEDNSNENKNENENENEKVELAAN